MNLDQKIRQICSNIQMLTGVHCSLAETSDRAFSEIPGGCGDCPEGMPQCIGCGKPSNGQFQYGCSCGVLYVETLLCLAGSGESLRLIAGPVRTRECGCTCRWEEIPYMQPEAVEALKATILALCEHLVDRQHFTHREWPEMAERPATGRRYPIEEERRLQQLIRAGDRAQASQLLNALMLEMYHRDGSHLEQMKYRVWELVTLMSRAALDSGADAEVILRLCDSRRKQIEQLQGFDELDHCLAEMLHQFFDIAFASGGKKHQGVIRSISRYMEAHLAERITLNDVAEHVHFSRSYLCRILKEETGSTFTEYLNQLRIERSKRYLDRQELPLSEIACLTGFDDQSYFTRIFKRYVGMPPGQYRTHGKSLKETGRSCCL